MFFYGLFRFGRMVARSGARPAPKRPPAPPSVTAAAWAVVALIALACWQPLLAGLITGVALLILMLSAWDRKPAPRSAPDPLEAMMHEILSRYDDNGRRKS